ncbi:MAG: glycoside hydrolase family 3 protein [Mycobacteriales bacterium]
MLNAGRVLIGAAAIAAAASCSASAQQTPNQHGGTAPVLRERSPRMPPAADAPARTSAGRTKAAPHQAPPSTSMLPTRGQLAAATWIAAKMTDGQAVGQLLMPQVAGSDADHVTPQEAASNRAALGVSTPAQAIRAFDLGGVILGNAGSSNVDNPAQLTTLTGRMQQVATATGADQPLLVSTDQEQGVVTRIGPPATRFAGNMALGATRSADLTRTAAADTGAELRAMGVNLDLAPDADVTAGEGNAVIGSRSFGSDPGAVSSLVAAAVTGYQDAGVAAVAKHFPGHGDTDVDSHVATPELPQSRAALIARDGAPFRAARQAGIGVVMVGHLDTRAIDSDTPASVSPAVVTGLLREQMGFTGVVMTDSMQMEPITSRYSAGTAALRAIQAGVDIVLMPQNLPAAAKALIGAIHDKTISRARINASVARIVALKGLLGARRVPASTVIGSRPHLADARAVARSAVTLLAGRCDARLIPAAVQVTGDDPARANLIASLRARGVRVVSSGAPVVAVLGYGDGEAPPAAVVVAANTPYVLARTTAPVRIAGYDSSPAAMDAVAAALTGTLSEHGRSPVAVTGLPRTAC